MINLFSRQIIQNERMNFPLLRVPQMLEKAFDEDDLLGFFKNRFLLAGLLACIFLHLLNGLHFYFPAVPQIPTLILAGPYFPKHGIFSGFHKLKIFIYPAFIGFAFLTSKQISFSFWFFFIFGGLLIGLLGILGYNIPAAALGVSFGPTLARPEETQMIGAYGVFFLFLLWLARYHIINVLRSAFAFKKVASSGVARNHCLVPLLRHAPDCLFSINRRLFYGHVGCHACHLSGRNCLFYPYCCAH
jgi:uncharacterized membrane protein YuzA (DUF378 family)